MSITPELAGFTLTLLAIAGSIWGASRKFSHLENRVETMEKDLADSNHDRKATEEKLGTQIGTVDQRVQRVETSVATIGVKVDALKEGVDEVKKLMSEWVTSKSKNK